MKRASKFWILFTWIIVATLMLAYVWGSYPNLFFYPPESISSWLINVYGSSNGEELADLELLYVLVCSFFIIAVLIFAFLSLKNALTKRLSGRQKKRAA